MHPLVQEWLAHPVSKLMFQLLMQQKAEYTDALINSDGFYSEAGIKHMLKLVGQIQLIDQLNEVSEFFPQEELIKLGDRE